MAKEISCQEIEKSIKQKQFSSLYLFQGEEPYFIDKLTDLIIENVLEDFERDFNQTIVYGSETTAAQIINACKRYPMMAERQLVVVKEAQDLKDIQELVHYVKSPLKSTVLVVNHKYKKLDGRKPLSKEFDKAGVVFESKKYYENQIPAFIISYVNGLGRKIDHSATQLLADYLGTDLSKLTNELDKLVIAIPNKETIITPQDIESNIGISKDYNNFELQKAIAGKDVLKANRIAMYFDQNQKSNPYIMTLNVLFNFFSNLMICQFETDKSPANLKNLLGFRFDFQLYDYTVAMNNYKPLKTMNNISLIREYDAMGKGFGNSGIPPGKLLIELLYKLMH